MTIEQAMVVFVPILPRSLLEIKDAGDRLKAKEIVLVLSVSGVPGKRVLQNKPVSNFNSATINKEYNCPIDRSTALEHSTF